MQRRQGSTHATVTLIGQDGDCSSLGDGDIGSRNAHIRRYVGLSQGLARSIEQHRWFRLQFLASGPGEKLGDLLHRLVHGRANDMGWSFPSELDNPFADISLFHLDAMLFQVLP